MAVLPDSFFQPDTFGTLFGCVAITTVVTGVIQNNCNTSPARTGLAISFLVVLASLFLADRLTDPKSLVVGFFNAFLVFASAAGATVRFAGGNRGDLGPRPFFRRFF